MAELEDIEEPTASQEHELAVIYFELSKIYKLSGMEEDAEKYQMFSRSNMKAARELSLNNPVYIREERLMYEYTGEPLPPDLEAAVKEQEEKAQEAKKKKGWLKRLVDSSSQSDNEHKLESETIEDAFRNVDSLEKALALKQKADAIKSRNYHEDLARTVERAFVKGMVVASLDDHEFECGVEGDYLREMGFSPEELKNDRSLRERVFSGEIDLSKMPEHFRQYNFGERVEVNEDFDEQMKLAEIRLEYLNKRIKKAKDPKQREALEYLKKQVESIILIGDLSYDNPEVLIQMGIAKQVSGPTDIGTANERKMFYFVNVVTRTLKPYIPQLANRMNGSVDSHEDVYSGWNLLKEKFPEFAEAETIGVPEMARALRELGPQGMRDAISGFINTSDGTPHIEETNGVVGFVKRAVDTVARAGYAAQSKMLEYKNGK